MLNPSLNAFSGNMITFSRDTHSETQILEHILRVTLGERIRRCYIDANGNVHDANGLHTTAAQ